MKKKEYESRQLREHVKEGKHKMQRSEPHQVRKPKVKIEID